MTAPTPGYCRCTTHAGSWQQNGTTYCWDCRLPRHGEPEKKAAAGGVPDAPRP